MIEKYLNDTISAERKPLEERMMKANLVEKYLQGRRQAVIKPSPQPTTPPPSKPDIPKDEPTGATTATQDERRRR
jgi:hypothetical protein